MGLIGFPIPTAGDLNIKQETVPKSIINSKAPVSCIPVTDKKMSSRADGGGVTTNQ